MASIFRGEPVGEADFVNKLGELRQLIESDLQRQPLTHEVVIDALHALAAEINRDEVSDLLAALGLQRWAIEGYVSELISSLGKEEMRKKVFRELGEDPFGWKQISERLEEKKQPLGVLLHIGAGNALGLSAFSIVEGLLTGNINILKLPEQESGISLEICLRLLEIEPRLKPYIYVFDISSKNEEVISQLIESVNAVVVWGSDETIKAIRQLTPPMIPIIEWGHRYSFAYFTKHEQLETDLCRLVEEIVRTDQLYCSSPQCVLYEASDREDLDQFAARLSAHLERAGHQFPATARPMDVQAQITWTQELIRMEEVLGSKKLFSNDRKLYSVMVDYIPKLAPAPLFRHVWVMPIKRDQIFSLARGHKGHLQTVGLSCSNKEFVLLSELLIGAGVQRITPCGSMSSNYSGEPHDGIYAMQRYTRVVNRRLPFRDVLKTHES